MKELLDKARHDLSSYCVNECNAYCCNKGYLVLNKSQLDLVTKGNHKNINPMKKDLFSLNLSSGCPSLSGTKCKIHKEDNRPQACKDFPLFEIEGQVTFSSRCPAVNTNQFYELTHELKQKNITYGISSI